MRLPNNKLFMIKLGVILLQILSIQIGYSQGPSGKIKIRKENQIIIGKSLSLYDMRTRECGSIFFNNDSICELTFTYRNEELKNIRVFLNSRSATKKVTCNYTLISDSSFVISTSYFIDTCYYVYHNKNSNLVRFYHLPQGVFEDDNYAFFYGLDSIVYSQSFLRSLADFNFTDSILKIDSIYNTIVDENEREKLNAELKMNLDAYKRSINFSFFAGKFEIKGEQINLLNENASHFATLFLQKKGDYFSLFTHCKFDFNYPLISMYTHQQYGEVIYNYDKGYIHFYYPNQSNDKVQMPPRIHHTDTLRINYPLGRSAYLYSFSDTFKPLNTDYFDYLKFNGILGGYYTCYLTSLNGLKIPTSPLFFGVSKAISVKDRTLNDTIQDWNYQIKKGIFFLYNDRDTLIDEMKNGFESFRFTYHNNQPYVFGAYHRKNKNSKKNEFIILFANNTGIKFTSDEFLYKYARKAALTSQLIEQKGINYTYFRYTATEENLWLEYQNGNYEEMSFFNFNKAIRQKKKGEKTKNYYLLD